MTITQANARPVEVDLYHTVSGTDQLVKIDVSGSGIGIDLRKIENLIAINFTPREVSELMRMINAKS
jgi:hypothetical protein